MKNITCCFTGHRAISNEMKIYLHARLESEIEKLINMGITRFCTGGALGFDTIAALSVIRKRMVYPHIKLILILPCKEQSRGWSNTNKEIYEDILRCADEVTYVSEDYTRYCMMLRNRALVDASSVCICYMEKQSGGTAYTVNYAEKSGLEIINLI